MGTRRLQLGGVADADIEVVVVDGPEPGRWHGLGGMAEAVRRFLTEWQDFTIEVVQARELGDGRVLMLVRHTGRGRTSGMDLARVVGGANVLDIRDGKVIRFTAYWDRDRALADLGVEEYEMPEESTTPDLVELLQRLIDAANAGDIDAAMNLFASDIVWEGRFETFEGRGALRGLFQDWLGTYDELELAAEEIRDLGNDVTFSVFIQGGRPRASAGWVQDRYGLVATWVDGLVRRVKTYLDLDEARAAAERLAQERAQADV